MVTWRILVLYFQSHELSIRRIDGGGFELYSKVNREAFKAGRHNSTRMSSLSRASRLCTQCLPKNGLLRPVAITLGRRLVCLSAYKHSLEKRSLPPSVQNTIRSSRLLSTSVSRLAKPSASSVDKRTVDMSEFPPERIRWAFRLPLFFTSYFADLAQGTSPLSRILIMENQLLPTVCFRCITHCFWSWTFWKLIISVDDRHCPSILLAPVPGQTQSRKRTRNHSQSSDSIINTSAQRRTQVLDQPDRYTWPCRL